MDHAHESPIEWEDNARDVLTTAVDDGSGYWMFDRQNCTEVFINKADDGTVIWLEFKSDVMGKVQDYTIDTCCIAEAARMVVAGEVQLRPDLKSQVESFASEDMDIDADAADCLLQIAAFNCIVFG